MAALIACVALVCPVTASAAKTKPTEAAIADKRSDLGDLRERIEQMKREVAAGESSRAEAADQLRDSERAISDLQRELRELDEQRTELTESMIELGQQTRSLATDLAAQQARLGRLLVRQYQSGSPDTIRLILAGRDPNQVTRDLYYVKTVAQARARLLKDIEAMLGRQRQLESEKQQQADLLAAVETQQRERHAKVARERDGRRKLLSRLAARITAQRKEIGALQRDEQRLSRLVDRLARLAAAPRPARKPAARAPEVARPGAGVAIDNRETPSAGLHGAFAKLRGSLRLPVAGTITGRFGSAREGGGTWKGVFIRAATGGEVKAIAPGQVVFADWMRGFGNLLIIDHGDAYLSIYGYNDALLRKLGDEVRSGDAIASVGNSGGAPESGLYFEIRHEGQPQDPMKWTGRR